MALGKRTVAARKNVDPTKVYKVTDAVKIVKGNAKAKFDETIEIAVNLGIDPKQADQNVRGVVSLPAGTGRNVRVAVFTQGDKVAAGDLLATVEVPELEADLLKAKAEMDAAEIDVKRLREARQKSPDLVLPQSVDNAEARFAGAKASVTRGSVLLEFAQIRAPFAGVIASRSVDPGAYVSPGAGPLPSS